MYGASNFAYQLPEGVHTTARYPGELGQYVWAPRGTIEGVIQCPSGPQLASEPVMNLDTKGANDLTTNDQHLSQFLPGSQDLRAHRGVLRNRLPGQTKISNIQPANRPMGAIFSPSLFATPTPMQENLVSTGILSNPYTGQEYETFENQLPPPNTDRSIPKEQLKHINPRLLHMQGGYNHHHPPPPKREQDGSVFKHVAVDSGPNPFGPQLYAKYLNDRQKEYLVRSTYNNRAGDQVVEPEIAKERPANYVGYVPRLHFYPYLPPTNELDGSFEPPADFIGTDTRKREEYMGAFLNNKPRVHVKDRVFAHNGPDGPTTTGEFDHIEPQRDGTFGVVPGPDLQVGSRQGTNWVLRPTQTLCALPLGMVTGIPLPPTRVTEMRGTSQSPLPPLPTAPASGFNAPTAHSIANPSLTNPSFTIPQGPVTGTDAPTAHTISNPSLKNPSVTMPQCPVTGTQAPAIIPVTTTRLGPQTVGALPAGQISGYQAPATIATTTMRTGPVGVGMLPPGLPALASAPAVLPSETMREGPQSVGSLPLGLPHAQDAPACIPTQTMRAGPQNVGCLPVALPSGQIAPAVVPTTMTTLSTSFGALPGALPTGMHGGRVNAIDREVSLTRRPDRPLPSGQVMAEGLGNNTGTTMAMRDLNNRLRTFEQSHTANPTAGNVGARVDTCVGEPLAWRGEKESEYQIGEFSGVVAGSGSGMRPPEPQNVRGRKMDEFAPYKPIGDLGINVSLPRFPQPSTVSERGLREDEIFQQMAQDM